MPAWIRGGEQRNGFSEKIIFSTGPTINDDACVDTGRRAAERVFGKDHLLDWEQQMGGEDFAKYEAPKCLLFLGGGFSEEARRYPQHSPYFDIDFDIDESALELGVRYFLEYVREYANEQE